MSFKKIVAGAIVTVVVGGLHHYKGSTWSAAVSGTVLCLIVGVKGLIHVFTGPMYIPGSLGKKMRALNKLKADNEKKEGSALKVAEVGGKLNPEGHVIETSDGEKLHYFSVGHGPEVVICVHGGPGYPTLEPWGALKGNGEGEGGGLDLTKYTIYFYHGRGCGHSSKPFTGKPSKEMSFFQGITLMNEKVGVERQILDIEEVRLAIANYSPLLSSSSSCPNAAVEQKKVHLVGHSFGGFLVALYAAELAGTTQISSYTIISPADVLQFPKKESNMDTFATMRMNVARTEGLTPEEKDTLMKKFETFMVAYTGTFENIFDHSEEDLVKLNIEFGEWYERCNNVHLKHIPSRRSSSSSSSPQEVYAVPPLDAKLVGGFSSFGLFFTMGAHHNYPPQMKTALKAAQRGSKEDERTVRMPPILFVHGDEDLMPLEGTTQYLDVFGPTTTAAPNSKGVSNGVVKLLRMPRSGHFIPQEATFTPILASHLESS